MIRRAGDWGVLPLLTVRRDRRLAMLNESSLRKNVPLERRVERDEAFRVRVGNPKAVMFEVRTKCQGSNKRFK